jgi:oligopeptide/dipeptide ABC transporter ATP-binding protein
MTDPLLELSGLRVAFGTGTQASTPLDGVSLSVASGECVGLVGESGSGKSLTLRAALGLLPTTARLEAGALRFDGAEYDPPAVRGRGISMIFQEPMSALNPLMRTGELIAEVLRARGQSRQLSRRRAIELMDEVGIPDAKGRARSWPHEFSGGMRQRVMIAMALASEPRVLLCDEPTTALDVTVQDQILGLLDQLRREHGLAIVLVTHNLALIEGIAQRLAVMYAGRIVEEGPAREVIAKPQHPYTVRLLNCVPRIEDVRARLDSIPGQPPDPRRYPQGCRFAPRCHMAKPDCTLAPYVLAPTATSGRSSACIHWSELSATPVQGHDRAATG